MGWVANEGNEKYNKGLASELDGRPTIDHGCMRVSIVQWFENDRLRTSFKAKCAIYFNKSSLGPSCIYFSHKSGLFDRPLKLAPRFRYNNNGSDSLSLSTARHTIDHSFKLEESFRRTARSPHTHNTGSFDMGWTHDAHFWLWPLPSVIVNTHTHGH